ncbi:PHP domain-containing protein [Agitococcus lubricus]|uniref:Polymerase/histidinol phosphatase N-terminal domain-containing protein n=1 Tax=Agitococcus lubricus TaxID=1077255 RepID=A0A2T5IZS8_9GAMM|nr:PHP domain-containing protein [Agitococcus lubricus]PTQ89567.1 hypothetical protein C8N29_10698 [Agitococcus lubricus]
MPVIDLHSHSLYSDGTESPSDLVAQAAAAGVEMLALTDHDSVAGLAEAQAAAKQQGICLVNGVELSAIWQQQLVHIIGLNINPQHPTLVAGLAQQAQARAKRARLIADKLQLLGLGESWPSVLAMADGDANRIGRAHFAQYLLAQGHVNQLQKAFDKYLATGKPAAVPMPWIDLSTAVQWIREAGGVPVLAHPARYGLSQTKLRALLADFVAVGGQAMEVSTANEKTNIIQNLAALAQRFNLHASQGSDFHGNTMTWLRLGRFSELPEQCRPVWHLFNTDISPVH